MTQTMKYLTLYILAVFISKKCNSCFTKNDKDIVLSLTKPLEISFCVLVKETCNNIYQLSNLLKEFSKENLYFSYLNVPDFLLNFLNDSIPSSRTMIIVKSEDEIDTKLLVEEIKEKVTFKSDFSKFTWIMLLPKDAERLNKNNFHVPYDCQFILAQRMNDGYHIKEIYQVKENTEMIYTDIGVKNDSFQTTMIDKYFYNRRKNMKGIALYLETTSQLTCRTELECTQLEIWLGLGLALNFTTKYIQRNGLDRRSIQPDATLQITPYHIYNPNHYYMVAPTLTVRTHVYIKFETEDELGLSLYLQPIQQDLRRALYALTLVSAFVIVIIAKAAKSQLLLDGFTLFDHALTPVTAFSGQSCIQKPYIFSSRIARFSTFVSSAVIFPAYSAALISCLTILRPKIPFTDLETFAQDGTYTMAAIYHPFIIAYFSYDPNPAVRKIHDNQLMPMKDFPRKYAEAYKIICNKKKFAMMAFNYRILKEATPCPIILVTDSVLNVYTGIALSLGSSYRGIFNKILLTIRASGALYKFQHILYGREVDKAQKGFEPISIRMTTSLHMFINVGIISSLMLLMVEISWERIKFLLKRKQGWKNGKDATKKENEKLKKEMRKFSQMYYWEIKKNIKV